MTELTIKDSKLSTRNENYSSGPKASPEPPQAQTYKTINDLVADSQKLNHAGVYVFTVEGKNYALVDKTGKGNSTRRVELYESGSGGYSKSNLHTYSGQTNEENGVHFSFKAENDTLAPNVVVAKFSGSTLTAVLDKNRNNVPSEKKI